MQKSKSRNYICGLDSLRCFAIVLIIIYHCFPNFLPGGFIAVEIFFALSGFLIGAKFIRESSSVDRPTGFFGFLKFAFVRLKRLFPALLFCIILTLSLAYFSDPDLLTSSRENTLYAATFSTNIASILSNSSYESSLIPNLFNHTWFLALELQVCLIAFIIFDLYFSIKPPKKSKNTFKGLTTICIFVAIMSYVLMGILAFRYNLFDRAYFGPDSHIGAFFLGAALSSILATHPKLSLSPKHRIPSYIIIFILLAGIAAASPFLHFSSYESFVFALPAVAISTCLLIILIKKLQTNSPPKFLIPFEYLGRISFYIYLFHWPLYILLSDILVSFLSMIYIPYAAIALSLILSILAERFVFPFFSKIKWYKVAILILLCILPVLALIKAPDTSSIEESISIESEEVPDTSESPNIDYSGIAEFSSMLSNNFMQYFDETVNFAKVYYAPVYTGAVAHGTYYGSGRAYFETPDLSGASLNVLANARVMVIGDSVTLGAQANILGTVSASFVDALGSRNMFDAINLLAGYRAANGGNLPRIIVIGLVTNYSAFGIDTLQTIMNTAGAGHQFVFVTGNCGDISRDAANNTIKAFAASNGNVFVADWASLIESNLAAYTYADHIHLTPAGRAAYADLINSITSGI